MKTSATKHHRFQLMTFLIRQFKIATARELLIDIVKALINLFRSLELLCCALFHGVAKTLFKNNKKYIFRK